MIMVEKAKDYVLGFLGFLIIMCNPILKKDYI